MVDTAVVRRYIVVVEEKTFLYCITVNIHRTSRNVRDTNIV